VNPEELAAKMREQGRCKCGRMNRTGNKLCRFCTSSENHHKRFVEKYDQPDDTIYICFFCKKTCEYCWTIRYGIIRCADCHDKVQEVVA